MLPVFTQIFYARKWPILIIFIVIALPFIILKLQDGGNKAINIFLLIDAAFCILLFTWAKYMSITVDNEGIEYRIIFKKISVPWKEIQLTKLAFEFHGKSGDFIWHFISNQNKVINFSTGYFSKNDLRLIAEVVVSKCPEHVIQGKIKEVSQGKFPWYVF